MAHQPQSSEEYIEKVLRQAAEQQKEEVPTHQQIKRREQIQKQAYQQKLKFFSLVLVLVVLTYIFLKVATWPFAEEPAQTEN